MPFHETRNTVFFCVNGQMFAAAKRGPKAGFILDMGMDSTQFVLGMDSYVKAFEADVIAGNERVA